MRSLTLGGVKFSERVASSAPLGLNDEHDESASDNLIQKANVPEKK